ncbi:MAG TPA: hypothetical protein VFN74_20515 [Chloroflexota bacterium]|nr:hypothetical protein [Chloroflexota bacterium]
MSGWSLQSRTDELGRTRYSIYIGDRLVVRDALSTDAAVIAARQWMEAKEGNRRAAGGAGKGADNARAQKGS